MVITYGLQDAKPTSLPMTPGCSLAPSDGKDATIPFRALLGQLQWVARCTRLDIMAAVSALSRFCASYGPGHFVALKQIVRYLKDTGVIHLASDYVNNNRSKHIEVRNMYIRELVKAKMVEALYVASADNTTDIFTKPLPLPAFLTHRERLGIMWIENPETKD
ncbi:hypothetical protein CYMTET_56596 [Cymbomonas tetramitiformis]|uniref:Uncharacterized protein n=1 Tax=Cymbomonas tetramitiformis TaxID=36881 RepID=A0AAE0BAZ6_9CHLO|nr:hypothetical protein CYMTET_56596 [Cymbomonas tetramitiformis]